MRQAILIENQLDFQRLLGGLAESSYVAIDTESNSFYAYFERVCLIQISVGEGDFVLDPFAIPDVSPLGEILENENIEKIFHAASNDLIGLKRDLKCCAKNIFDTAIAAKLLGRKKLGLASILSDTFGVSLNKKWQRYNWARRPLQPEQISYARLDTHYLIPLRNLLAEELTARGLWQEAKEAFEKICTQEVQERVFQPNGFVHIKGAHSLNSRSKQTLKDLYRYREQEAKRRNRAPFRVLSNETLVRLALSPPSNMQELTKIKGLPRTYQNSKAAHDLLELLRRTRDIPEDIRL